ncbi:MAG: 4'-phosphopantetheinyl transferase superfamily protein [Firmicutes bacterium]|nr:4'-phosphopantetheinyl transferase superfamily protein [Bacillota bacterium]
METNMKIFYSSKLNNPYDSWQTFVHVMNTHLGIPADTEVLRTSGGKPFFMRYPDIHFSVSHTKNHWLCIFCDVPVGIDAELCSRKIHNSEKILDRFFSENERRSIKDSTDPGYEMISVWTQKEACLKMKGQGVFKDMKYLDVKAPEAKEVYLQTVTDTADGEDSLIITVCTAGETGYTDLEIINIDKEISDVR